MGSRIRCFGVEQTGSVRVSLRRYVSSRSCKAQDCPGGSMSYHNASVDIGTEPAHTDDRGYLVPLKMPPRDDPRWPATCICGYEFADDDEWQINQDHLYAPMPNSADQAPATGPWTMRDMPAGAMLYPSWLQPDHGYTQSVDNGDTRPRRWQPGPDGKVLMVVTPRGEWIVDSRASNCTLPEDNKHRCWVRHGEIPDVNVDKNGLTCGAGGGSIMIGDYHGFLRNGWLEEC